MEINVSNRPNKALTDRFLDAVIRIKGTFSRPPLNINEFDTQISSMLTNIHEYLTVYKGKPGDIKNRLSNARRSKWTDDLSALSRNYNLLYNAYTALIDEENAINRIEKKAHMRAVFYRILTTLGIGFSIMFVYWVAQYLGISMPLMKLPV